MSLILYLIVGGIIGWIASIIMRTDASQGIILNVVVGIVGAFLGGLLISPLLGIASMQSGAISLGGMVVALLGAIILLAVLNLIRRGSVR